MYHRMPLDLSSSTRNRTIGTVYHQTQSWRSTDRSSAHSHRRKNQHEPHSSHNNYDLYAFLLYATRNYSNEVWGGAGKNFVAMLRASCSGVQSRLWLIFSAAHSDMPRVRREMAY